MSIKVKSLLIFFSLLGFGGICFALTLPEHGNVSQVTKCKALVKAKGNVTGKDKPIVPGTLNRFQQVEIERPEGSPYYVREPQYGNQYKMEVKDCVVSRQGDFNTKEGMLCCTAIGIKDGQVVCKKSEVIGTVREGKLSRPKGAGCLSS